ncbi:hypothetical protein ABB37_08685 [Leptomonas pyrrhocoris]|uniref:Uncharacterized protein n=1 Tax=Leptomonas pyrrhocoris TaxID=157538 RepID=A0A0M9FT98_LEPPY|nr:hypothetical protein ABB37_08685 [Leptomonas pyrrhocoris]KPA75416.1 hypothetical protein ABB37_08685 [Leptomonas pyrrhocoris]|eukprot:XP_015653855.1 hypothetical protein ABB37_08685 [Leptomonas pyrrhocoris]
MKCTLNVMCGKERSQRSRELTEKLTSRDQLVAFLKSQDLRLEAGDFDFTVSLDGVDDARQLKTDADVRLFLAQARTLGDRATFHIRLPSDSVAQPDAESCIPAEYAVDLELATLQIYGPAAAAASAAASVASAASSAPSSPSHGAVYQEKMFVVPTRFVLDGLIRAVKDTLNASTLKKNSLLTLYAMSSQDDVEGVALMDDTAALDFLHRQAKRREPARLTYSVAAAPSPSARHVSPPPSPSPPQQQQQQQQQHKHQNEATASTSKPSSPPPPVDGVAPRASRKTSAKLPPLHGSEVHAPATTPTQPSNSSPHPPRVSPAPAETPDTQRSSTHISFPSSPASTPYRAFLREPTVPTSTAEVQVEVRLEDSQTFQTFTFSYLRTEVQLCRRFLAECSALFAATTGTPVLTLSNDPSAVIDGDGVLRELLALAREAQQPLRTRLRFRSPSKPHPSRANDKTAALPQCAAPVKDASNRAALKPTPGSGADVNVGTAPHQLNSKSKSSNTGGNASSSVKSPSAPSQPRLPRLSVGGGDSTSAAAGGEGSAKKQISASSRTRNTASSPHPPKKEATSAATIAQASSKSSAAAPAGMEDEGGPSPVMSTTPGPSHCSTPIPSSSTRQHPCFCEVDSCSGSSSTELYRFQATIRWGTAQRMARCRVRADHLYDDVCRGVADGFADHLTQSAAPTPALTMALVHMKAGVAESLPLTETTLIKDLPTDLCVESAELRVTSPALPASLPTPPGESPNDTALPAGDAALRFIAAAAVRQLESVSLPLTTTEVHTLARSLLGDTATAEPFKTFLAHLHTPSTQDLLPSPADRERDGAAAAALLGWLQRVLADLPLPPPQTQMVLQDIASSLLCADLCNADYTLLHFFTEAAAAFGHQPTEVTSAALRSLFQLAEHTAAGKDKPVGEESTTSANAATPTTGSEWKAAFDKAPSIVLDVLAAARIDGVLTTAPAHETRESPLGERVWREAFRKAQLQFCKTMAPTELETYFRGEKVRGATEDEQLCRAVLLSCMGALLAPASFSGDYGTWLVNQFCGRVGAMLYTRMGAFDGRTELSLPALTVLSWSVLNPRLLARITSAAQRALLEQLVGWVRVAAAHACYVRQLPFPLCPLHGVHASLPSPLSREFMPPPPPSDAGGVPEGTKVERALSRPTMAADRKAADDAPAAPLTPSPPLTPSLTGGHPASRKTPNRKVQYVYKYNFNALHRPRYSGN